MGNGVVFIPNLLFFKVEGIQGDKLHILLYLDPVTGNVEGMEFEFIIDEDYHGFNDIPLEKWAKFDKLIMNANFTFTIPPELKDANYEHIAGIRLEMTTLSNKRCMPCPA